jgi:hypothetical protein
MSTESDQAHRFETFDKGEWFREQISAEEWDDYDWVKVETFGQSAKFLRGLKRS